MKNQKAKVFVGTSQRALTMVWEVVMSSDNRDRCPIGGHNGREPEVSTRDNDKLGLVLTKQGVGQWL